jgi:hypothetical protein
MASVYVEPRPKGRRDGDPIDGLYPVPKTPS